MDAKKFLEADYLDIVFENRNKAYGSYELRKNYARRVKKAGSFALLAVVALASFSFITSNRKTVAPAYIPPPTVITEIQKLEKEIPKPPVVAPPPPPPAAPTASFADMTISPDDLTDKPPAEITDLTNVMPGVANNKGDSSSMGEMPIAGNGPKTPLVIPVIDNTPVSYVDQMPEFAGDLGQYLSDHISYPENARAAGIQGRVVVSFVVNVDGAVVDLKISRSLGSGCDEEAMRVIKGMPKWKPGKLNGKAVRTIYNQPISFKLD